MGLFDKMLNYFGYEKARAYVTPVDYPSSGGSNMGKPTQQNFTSYLKQYTDTAWVFTCIQRIASQGAGVPLKLYKKTIEGDKVIYTEVMSHPILKLLDKVNPFLTGTDLIEITLYGKVKAIISDTIGTYAFPNPFNPESESVRIVFSMHSKTYNVIKILDANGDLVKEIDISNANYLSGNKYSIAWNGRNSLGDLVVNGVYFYMIEDKKNRLQIGKIAVLK